nr:hypothetical protein [Tanacetum cinerariifolium]
MFFNYEAKESIATQTCKLSKEEFNDFPTLYLIPSECRVILPKSNQTVFDAPPGYVRLYTHSFSLANLRLPFIKYFYEVRKYSKQRPAIMAGGKEMAFRKFIYTIDDEDLLFLPKEPSLGFDTNFGEFSKPELFVVHPESISARIKDRKFSDDNADATAFHLKISGITPLAWKNHLDNYMDVELLDLHDHCYARHAVVENDVNSRGLWEECEELRAKCEAVITEFKKNSTVVAIREKISALSTESLSTLKSKVTSLEAEKERLEAVEVSFRKEVEEFKQDRRNVASKIVSYAVMELVHSDDMGSLIGRPVSRYLMWEANNNFATATFLWLDEFMANPSAPIKALFSKKPPSLQRPAPSRTQVPLPSS